MRHEIRRGLVLSSVYLRNLNHALLITAVGIAAYIGIRKLGYKEVQMLSNSALLPLFDAPVINRRVLRVFVDLAIISFSYYAAFLLRFEGDFVPVKNYYLTTLPLVLMTKTIVFHLAGLYKGAWRYTNISDLMRMVRAVVLGCAASALLLWSLPGVGITSRAALLIDFNLLLMFVVTGVDPAERGCERSAHRRIGFAPPGHGERSEIDTAVGRCGSNFGLRIAGEQLGELLRIGRQFGHARNPPGGIGMSMQRGAKETGRNHGMRCARACGHSRGRRPARPDVTQETPRRQVAVATFAKVLVDRRQALSTTFGA